MKCNYRTELVQVAAVALAAAQLRDTDTTRLDIGSREGSQGAIAFNILLTDVRIERERQEIKWGARTSRDAPPAFWLAVLLEEVGEVAEEILASVPSADGDPLVKDAIRLGQAARAFLEAR
jgi:hypothetical protein